MKAIVLNTITGSTKEVNNISSFNWAENNWSCDCNRDYFDHFNDEDDDGYCVGCNIFLVIKAEFEKDERKYSLLELNEDYPKEMLDKFLPKDIFGTLVVFSKEELK